MTTITTIGVPGSGHDFQVGDRRDVQSIDDLADHYRRLIDGPYIATLATHGSNGRVQLSPMWFQADHDRIHVCINTKIGRAKDKHMQANPNVSIQVIDNTNFYHWITIYGTIVERIEETDLKRGHLATQSIDELAQLYLGESPYPLRSDAKEQRALYRILPSQIVTFGEPT